MKVLCVAEKPSMARQLASILSSNGFETRNGRNKYCKNFSFAYMKGGERLEVVMTSVLGHVMEMDFGPAYANWSTTVTEDLFNVPIVNAVNPGMKDVAENLKTQARQAQILIIWTDCDREGEYIGWEVELICREANSRLDVYRAKYSVVSPRDIHRAMQNLQRLDQKQVEAVAARQEIDLRSGATLTRLQSMGFQRHFQQLKGVISYGSCQFPTLGFVVEQYLRVIKFVPHDFWTLKLALKVDDIQATFNWDRNRLFDKHACAILYQRVLGFSRALVKEVRSNPTSKWRPFPLRTVEFQKKASKSLRLSSDKLMSIAEALYNKGYISYPRTETDQFDSKFDHKTLISNQRSSMRWGAFASALLDQEGRFGLPRLGKNNDKAHPPIHPTKAGDELTGDEAKVYEFIARSYLAACSQDAKGQKTTILLGIGEEFFHAQGTIVLERNYLDVYPYEGWNDRNLPNLQVGQQLTPASLVMESGRTTAPQLLSEPELIGSMDKNGIGTDATIHEHIKKIIDRNYVLKINGGGMPRFLPTILGLSLVEGYDQIGLEFSLTKPRLRATLEADLTCICNGAKGKQNVIREAVEMYRVAFNQAKGQIEMVYRVLSHNLGNINDPYGPAPLPAHSQQQEPRGPPSGRNRPSVPLSRRRPRPESSDDDDNNSNNAGHSFAFRGGTSMPSGMAENRDENREQARNGPDCTCGKPSSMQTTRKAGPNHGRPFWSCRDCNFFNWADVEGNLSDGSSFKAAPVPCSIDIDDNPPICGCGKAAVVRTVSKEGPNKGRQFYCCSSDISAKCSFFLWKDNISASSLGTEEAILRCPCNLIVAKDTIKSGSNAGKAFLRCSKQVKRCTFFQWEEPGGSTQAIGGEGRCFKCGQEGHFAPNCPSAGRGSSSRRPRARGRGGSRRGRANF